MSDDLISRGAAIDAFYIQSDDDGWWVGTAQDAETLLNGLPTAEKVGKWVKAEKGGEWWYACSMCEGHIPKTLWGQDWHSSYCPNCGARMEGEEDDPDKD